MAAMVIEIGRRRKNHVRRVSVKTSVPITFGVGARSDFSPNPLPSSVPTINMSASCVVLRAIATARRPYVAHSDARRRRNGGGPGRGCARRPVGTYLYLHAVGAGNPVAVPGLAR
jgi:hypothetical protein